MISESLFAWARHRSNVMRMRICVSAGYLRGFAVRQCVKCLRCALLADSELFQPESLCPGKVHEARRLGKLSRCYCFPSFHEYIVTALPLLVLGLAMEDIVTAAGVETGLLFPDKTSQTSFTVPVAGSPSDSDASSASFHTAASGTSFTCGGEMEEDAQQHGSSGGEEAKTTPSDTANDDVMGNAGGYTPSNEVVIGAVGGVQNGGGKCTDSGANTSDTGTGTDIAQPTATEKVSVVLNEELRRNQRTVELMCSDGSEAVKQPSGEMVEQLDSVNQGERRSNELVQHSLLATNGGADKSENQLDRVVELGNQRTAGDGLVSSVGGALSRPPTVEEREGEAMEYQNEVGEAMHHNEDTFEEAGKQTVSQQLVVKREDEEPMETAAHETTDNTPEIVEESKTEKEDSSSKRYGEFEKPPLEEEEGGRGEGEGALSVSSSGYGGSRDASPEEVGGVITEDMKEEEKRLRGRESREQSVGEEVKCLDQSVQLFPYAVLVFVCLVCRMCLSFKFG